MSRIIHTIPLGGDEPVHMAALNCWCQPIIIPAENAGEHDVMAHHAKDQREKFERQGLVKEGLSWGLVWGTREAL